MREHGAGNEATIATLLDLQRDLVQALAQHAASVPPPAPVATPGGGGGVPPAPVATPGGGGGVPPAPVATPGGVPPAPVATPGVPAGGGGVPPPSEAAPTELWLRPCQRCGKTSYWREHCCLNPSCEATCLKF